MKFLEAVAATQEVMSDLDTHDSDMALNQALQYINKVACGDTKAHPLLQAEACEIAFALYRGEENSE